MNEFEPCTACKSGFNSYDQYPFNCYLIHTGLNFLSAKSFCENLNSTLWSPKTLSERSVYTAGVSWLNSIISYVGEPFVWPDGSLVYGFPATEPNNSPGNDYLLNEDALVMNSNFILNDIKNKYIRTTVCQQN